ncbi:NADP-dependent L-serine/L-allo-threonine dehydrogenase YdfG [Klebsiella michiganensis]|uniref:NADP-dependent L-serine/L-allo-threonine dehydrogenase YdfG n=1 Tax=Klebsiella michiganensis TaxID=1134687 RepID=A0A7H4MYD4_9ENTR|nr:NADP-dependent L-serine/L-allo-threonine dehydrogenase YdfG [Klebsiella michiganensis]
MIILVTGATAGFGESITRRFIANGHKVIATGRREERLKTLKDELGENLYTAQLDVRNRAAIEELIAGLRQTGRRLMFSSIMPGWRWDWSPRIKPTLKTGKT